MWYFFMVFKCTTTKRPFGRHGCHVIRLYYGRKHGLEILKLCQIYAFCRYHISPLLEMQQTKCPLIDITDTLINHLILSPVALGQHCPVVLVGHSLGGIVIKSLLVWCMRKALEEDDFEAERIQKFSANCKGVFFYSTAHIGSRLADFVYGLAHIGSIRRSTPHIGSKLADFVYGLDPIVSGCHFVYGLEPFVKLINWDILKLLTTFHSESRGNHKSFKNIRKKLGIRTAGLGESLDTKYMGLERGVVEDHSASADVDDFGPSRSRSFQRL